MILPRTRALRMSKKYSKDTYIAIGLAVVAVVSFVGVLGMTMP